MTVLPQLPRFHHHTTTTFLLGTIRTSTAATLAATTPTITLTYKPTPTPTARSPDPHHDPTYNPRDDALHTIHVITPNLATITGTYTTDTQMSKILEDTQRATRHEYPDHILRTTRHGDLEGSTTLRDILVGLQELVFVQVCPEQVNRTALIGRKTGCSSNSGHATF